MNGLICSLLYRSPGVSAGRTQMILIDPKRVKLEQYSALPHTLAHASGFFPDPWCSALEMAVRIMDNRFLTMEQRKERMYSGGDLYVFIDEWINVYKNGGKKMLQCNLAPH